ncbi:hypothetical protein B0H11DRAFT_2088995 [Mycena galericulata]|nr:hypothetical protein B0H11DRAFT_2088995 [Mycena galericulata]
MKETMPFRSESTSSSVLLDLAPELILQIYDYLAETELLHLCQVSVLAKQIALPVLLARCGVSEAQIQSQELINVPSRALRALCAACPTVIASVKVLDLHFDEDFQHWPVWRFLAHLGECLPAFPRVTLTFSKPPALSTPDKRRALRDRRDPLMGLFSRALVSLVGAGSKPVCIFDPGILRGWAIVRPGVPPPPDILTRAWSAIVGPSTTDYPALPRIDENVLVRTLERSITPIGRSTPFLVQSVHLQSFTEPTTPLGSLIVLDPRSPWHLSHLDHWLRITEDIISRAEWHFILLNLNVPSVRWLSIGSDLECNVLAAFLDNHHGIENMTFKSNWSHLHLQDAPPFSPTALPHLKHLSAGPRIIIRLLQTYEFSLLQHVSVDAPSNDPEDSRYLSAALRAMAAHPSVEILKIDLRNLDVPWNDVDATEGRAEQAHNVRELHIHSWKHPVDHHAFIKWLAMFPALHLLNIFGRAPGKHYFWTGRLVSESDEFVEAIKEACPQITLLWHIRKI